MNDTFDLTPDPKVLIALTQTPMAPLDALCELIDNAIDSFQVARITGDPVANPLVAVDVPRPAELRRGEGLVRVRDNGPGMDRQSAENSIRAGFSGNNPYDSLGLFGMGFNISTGKLGRRTRFLTAQEKMEEAIQVLIDLDQLRESRSYEVPAERVPKPSGFQHGTEVSVGEWWPEGNPNNGFVRKLAGYGLPQIRRELGRRYATLLREKSVRVLVNGEECAPFEHCAWADHRSVKRQKIGEVPAVFRFDEVVGTQVRCMECTANVPGNERKCPACGSASLRTIEERIEGWVGIQRFDDQTHYGVDLIRNGRAIRTGEKSAFFEYVDEFKQIERDYPIDSPFGRIVGEVHLDHVPVDYTKQDFQRSSAEWQNAMKYLRGESSLQPKKPGATDNSSPIFKLYQGYRRVRRPGRADMYMGYWDADSETAKRISREEEQELYGKFEQRVPGFFDDSEWWKLVEQADTPPPQDLVDCPECGSQNLQGHDRCAICSAVLIAKPCINPDCEAQLAVSDTTCEACGTSQVPEVVEPWTCAKCHTRNPADTGECTSCGAIKGADDPLAPELLREQGHRSDDLSVPGCSVKLADGQYSSKMDVTTYVMPSALSPMDNSDSIPMVVLKGDEVEIFIDLNHRVFKSLNGVPHQMIASEVALYIFDTNRQLSGRAEHTVANLTWAVLQERWASVLADGPDRVKADAEGLLDQVREQLPSVLPEPQEVLQEFDDDQKRGLTERLLANEIDITTLPDLQATGEYLRYVDEPTVVWLFEKFPASFFDGKVWQDPFGSLSDDLDAAVVAEAQRSRADTYLNCLQDVANYLVNRAPDPVLTRRARASVDFLGARLA